MAKKEEEVRVAGVDDGEKAAPTPSEEEAQKPKEQPKEQPKPKEQTEDVMPDELDIVARQLAELMRVNPDIAAKIADILESTVLEKEEPIMSTPSLGNEPIQGFVGQIPAAPTTAAPSPTPSVDPTVAARLEEIERQMADHELDRELSRITGRYGQLRGHFGDILPENLEERALLQKAHEVITGKASPFDVALAALLLEQVTSGDGTLRDRILASAAKTVQKPPSVEGRGGGVAATEGTPDVSKMSTTQLMDYIKGAFAAKRGQPG